MAAGTSRAAARYARLVTLDALRRRSPAVARSRSAGPGAETRCGRVRPRLRPSVRLAYDRAISTPADNDHDSADPPREPHPLDALPGVVRIATSTGLRAAAWGAENSLKTSVKVARRLPFGGLAVRAVEEAAGQARRGARQLLGVEDVEEKLRRLVPEQTGDGRRPGDPAERPAADDLTAVLQERGAGLLAQAADVRFEEETHPAFLRILDELSPDEARILRLLTTKGPQPAVDVRTGRPLRIGSELVAAGLTVVGAEAGCRYGERVPAYLNNLFRLGLIWFSHEELHDLRGYQVLEAQPEIKEARARAGRAARVIRRSIVLTPFGEDFCRACLPLGDVVERPPARRVDGR